MVRHLEALELVPHQPTVVVVVVKMVAEPRVVTRLCWAVPMVAAVKLARHRQALSLGSQQDVLVPVEMVEAIRITVAAEAEAAGTAAAPAARTGHQVEVVDLLT
jgi:hypothetical protein